MMKHPSDADIVEMRPSEIREYIAALAEAQAAITRHEYELMAKDKEIQYWKRLAGYMEPISMRKERS